MQTLGEIVRETIQWFDDLMPVEEAKLRAASRYSVAELEDIMKREQVAILRLKGLDKKREEVLAARGLPGLSLREILGKLPGEEREELAPLYEELERRFSLYKTLSEDINELLRNNIHTTNRQAENRASYERQEREKQAAHFTSRKA